MTDVKIECLYAGDDPVGIFCKGDVDDYDFLNAVAEYDKRELENNLQWITEGHGTIKRTTVRCVPCKDRVYLRKAESGSRGAFNITFVDFEDAVEF